MKIIRHSHKMFVYSLSLLLSAPQILCMQEAPQEAPAAHADQKSIHQLTTMLAGHDNVDQLIDTMQKAIGGIDDQDGKSLYNFSLTLPGNANNRIETQPLSHDELAEFLCEKQDQRQTYDNAYFFNWAGYWEKDHNKKLIRNNFVSITMAAYAQRCVNFKPDTSIIDNLPKRSKDIDSLKIIRYLQAQFADIDPKKTCLSKKVEDIRTELNTIHHFFDNPPCCWYSLKQKAKKLQYNVFLRSHVIPFVYFIEKQKRLKTLQLPKRMPANDQDESQKQSNPYASNPSIIIIGSNGQQYSLTPHQGSVPPSYTEKPQALHLVANPFIPGSGVGSLNGDPTKE